MIDERTVRENAGQRAVNKYRYQPPSQGRAPEARGPQLRTVRARCARTVTLRSARRLLWSDGAGRRPARLPGADALPSGGASQ